MTKKTDREPKGARVPETRKTVRIYMEGGCVQDVETPPGVEVVITDQDEIECGEKGTFVYDGGNDVERDWAMTREELAQWRKERRLMIQGRPIRNPLIVELEQQRDELLAALKDVELRMTQAGIASGIGKKKNQTEFLLGELERMQAVTRAAIAKHEGSKQ